MSSSDSGISFDDSLWPLLLIRPVSPVTAQQQDEGLARIATFLRRGDNHLIITDMRRLNQVPLDQRHRQIDWFREYESLIRKSVLGVAFIINSPIVRLSLNVILHFKTLPVPHLLDARLDITAAWAATRFQEAGLHSAAARVRQHFSVP